MEQHKNKNIFLNANAQNSPYKRADSTQTYLFQGTLNSLFSTYQILIKFYLKFYISFMKFYVSRQ